MKIVCPKNPEHKKFSVTAHVAETWAVDSDGHFVEVLEPASDVVHSPVSGDFFECIECGCEAEATVS